MLPASLLIACAWSLVLVTSKPGPTKWKNFKEKVYRDGTCYNGYTNILIELSNGVDSYTYATICHDESRSETLFVRSILRGADLDESEPISRPAFKEAGFYPDISADECYTQAAQWETVAELLGSEDLADEYIQPDKNVYISRGHVTPNGDGIEGYEKAATFYFVNVVGQWQTINGGNWNQMESMTRWVAGQRQGNLTIYTGAFGVTTLPDVNQNDVEIWLGRDSAGNLLRKLPVPHSTWKVIHDEVNHEGVAIIQINNPWNPVHSSDLLCPDLCDQLSWVNWDTTNSQLGYTYCCDVAAFSKAVPYAPNLGSLPLLDESITTFRKTSK